MYTDNGFWDTFRAQFPLNALIHSEFHEKYIVSLLDAYDQSGWLPSWSFPGHQGGMIGNHAASLIADYIKSCKSTCQRMVNTFYDKMRMIRHQYHESPSFLFV